MNLFDISEQFLYLAEQDHSRAYWSDSNPRPPQGHNEELKDCQDPECVANLEMYEHLKKTAKGD